MIPWVHYFRKLITNQLLMEGDEDLMSDIMFMSQKTKDGKLVKAEGELATTGELLSFIPATGKTFYLAGSHCQVIGGSVSLNSVWDAELKKRHSSC